VFFVDRDSAFFEAGEDLPSKRRTRQLYHRVDRLHVLTIPSIAESATCYFAETTIDAEPRSSREPWTTATALQQNAT
jgi:hypothetical protein